MDNIINIFDNPKVGGRRQSDTQDLIDFAIDALADNQEQIEMAITLVAITALESDLYTDEQKDQIIIQFTKSLQSLINKIRQEVHG